MNEIKRENDIFVSTLLNPEANVNDLIHGGVTANNTQLLTPEQYKDLDFIKKQFSDKKGNFDEELFNRVYGAAAQKFNDLTTVQSYKDLEKLGTYNPNDIYAPFGANKEVKGASISRVRNPFEQTTGIRSLFGTQDSEKSVRELAQKNKIFDTETGKYLDKSAEDLGLFGGLFSKPLVYATWDEDGTHFDSTLGREVSHRKGDYKLNEDGKFYTETIGNKQGYGKQYVALSDILTKEDSWLNKVDFFDSDDKDKSAIGVIMKTAAKIAPYFIPYVNTFWGGATAVMSLAEVMPTFAKMLEGLTVGDRETAFTRKMNSLENYWKRFDNSYSDEAQGKLFGMEQLGSTVSDIFGQLYQMRFMAGLARYGKFSYAEANRKGFENFLKNHGDEFAGLVRSGKIKPTENGVIDFWKSIAASSPEMQEVMRQQSELAKKLSLGYMALTSSADVYEEALQGGYSRRVAGLAALAATAGQYGIMMNNELGTWFLNKTTGYTEGENRRLMRQAIKPLYDQIAKEIEVLAPNATNAEKQAAMAKAFTKVNAGIKNIWDAIKNGSSEFWTRSVVEAVEEVTEEAVMDATKGMVDFLTWAGLGGEKNQQASFNTIEKTFSKEGLARYAQNALGGFIGGSLFQLQEMHIEPWLTGKHVDRNTEIDLIRAIQEGHAEELKDRARELGKIDNNVLASEIKFGDQAVAISADPEQVTRGDVIAQRVIDHIEYLQGVLNDYQLNLTGDDLFKKVIRDQQILPLIKDSGITNIVLDDFHNACEKVVKLQEEIDTLQHKENLTDEDTTKLRDLENQKKDIVEQLNEFLSGEAYEPYLKMSLAYLNPAIRDNLTNISLYQFAKAKYGKEFSTYPVSGVGTTQESIRRDYDEYKRTTDKKEQMQMLMTVFDNLEQQFSPAYKAYSDEHYADVRRNVFRSVISNGSFNIGKEILDKDYFGLLSVISEQLTEAGLPGATLNDILQVDKEVIKNNIIIPSLNGIQDPIVKFAEQLGINTNTLIDTYADVLSSVLNSLPVQQWNTETINTTLRSAHQAFAETIVERLKQSNPELSKADIDALLESMNIAPEDIEVPESKLATYLANMTMPSFDVNMSENLAQNTINTYITNEETLDGEILKFLKESAISSLTTKKSIIDLEGQIRRAIGWYDDDLGYDVELALDDEDRTNIVKCIKQHIDEEKDLNSLIDAISNGLLTKYTNKDNYEEIASMLEQNPEMVETLPQIISDFLTSNNAYNQYLQAISKQIQKNPLYELLRNLEVELSPQVNQTIFDLLEIESKNLQSVPSISEYLKMPDVLEQIDSAESVISVARAILAGMEDYDLDFDEHLFGFNAQVRQYLEKFKEGKNADKYQTIRTEDIYTIGKDLDLIEQKLEFIKNLSNQNVQSKVEEDNRARENFQKLIVNELKTQASKLTIKGVSICTPDDLAILEDETIPMARRIGKVEHNLYVKFREIVDQSSLEEAVIDLITNLNVDIKAISASSLESYGISPDVKDLSAYDFLVYLTTILGVDQNDYNYRYKAYLLSQENDKVPLFSQEYATKIAYSFLKDVSEGVHDIVARYFNKISIGYPAAASRIYFLDGVSGSGKTTAVAKALLEFDSKKDVLIAAPNTVQANKLNTSLGTNLDASKVLNKEQLLKLFLTDQAYNAIESESSADRILDSSLLEQFTVEGIGSYYRLKDATDESLYKQDLENIPSVLFIDEITHFNTAELQALNHAAEKYNFKIIALGDTLQESAKIIDQENHIDSIFTWKSARLNLSIRPANVNKKETIERFLTLLQSYYLTYRDTHNSQEAYTNLKQILENNGLLLKYYEDDENLDGDKVVSVITAADLNRLKAAAKGEKIGIIAKLNGTENTIDNLVDQDLKAAILSSNLSPEDYIIYSPDKISNFAVQGSEADYFVINDTDLTGNTPLTEVIVRLYTFITRSQKGSLIKLSEDVARLAHIDNKLTAKPGIFKLPGLAQLSTIKGNRIADIDSIIGNWVPSTTETTTTVENNISETELETKAIDEAERVDPSINVSNDITTDLPPTHNAASPLDLFSYAFYNHTGLLESDLGEFQESDRTIPLDLAGIFPVNSVISNKSVLGFIKLKNLVTLYPNTNSEQFKSGLRYIPDGFTEDIVEFVKAINPSLKNLDGQLTLKWLLDHLTIHPEQYIVAVKMNRSIDSPAYKFGLDRENEVEEGEPLLLGARRITIQDGSFVIDRMISTQALAKSSTVANGPKEIAAELFPVISSLEAKARVDLVDNNMIIYQTPELFTVFDRADGRIVKRRDNEAPFFDSLAKMLAYGVNVKETGLIVGTKNSEGKYRFIEWAKKYNPAIEKVAFDGDDNFLLAGKYFARVSYTTSKDKGEPSMTDHLLILDLTQITFKDAIKKIKSIQSNLAEKNKILHEKSQTDLVLNLLNQFGAFKVGPQSVTVKDLLTDILGVFKKNPDIHSRRIEAIEEFLNNGLDTTEESVRNLLIDPRMTMFGVLFVDHFLSIDSAGNITSRYAPLVFTDADKGYQNISPVRGAKPDPRGIYALSDFDPSIIGLRNRHYEPRRYGISKQNIEGLTKVDIDFQTRTTIEPQSEVIDLPEAILQNASKLGINLSVNGDKVIINEEFEFDKDSLVLFNGSKVLIDLSNPSKLVDGTIIAKDKDHFLVKVDNQLLEATNTLFSYGDLSDRPGLQNFEVNGAKIPSIEVQAMIPGSKWLTDNLLRVRLVDPQGNVVNAYEIAKVLFEARTSNSPTMENIIKEVTYTLRKKLGVENFSITNTNGVLYLTYNGETHPISDPTIVIDDNINISDLIEDISENQDNNLIDENNNIIISRDVLLYTYDNKFLSNNVWHTDITPEAEILNIDQIDPGILEWVNNNINGLSSYILINNEIYVTSDGLVIMNTKDIESQLQKESIELEENSPEEQEEIENEIIDNKFNSEDPTSEEQPKVDFLKKYAKLNKDDYDLIHSLDDSLNLDSAYLEVMGEDFKQAWLDLNNELISCNNG